MYKKDDSGILYYKTYEEDPNGKFQEVEKSFNIEDFKIMLNDLRKGEYFGKVIHVNCDSFDYQKDQSLLDKIKDFITQ